MCGRRRGGRAGWRGERCCRTLLVVVGVSLTGSGFFCVMCERTSERASQSSDGVWEGKAGMGKIPLMEKRLVCRRMDVEWGRVRAAKCVVAEESFGSLLMGYLHFNL